MPTQKTDIPVVLSKNRIFIISEEISKEELVAKLVRAVCADLADIDPEDALGAVLKREQGIPTAFKGGLSIPHARVDDIYAFQAAAAVIPGGMPDDSGAEIKFMFLFLSPSGPQYFSPHLKLLASLAEKFTPDFVSNLIKLNNKEEILNKISF